jgi:HSP20 family protein
MPRAQTHAVAPYQQQSQNPLWDMQRRMNMDFNRLLRDPFGALTTLDSGSMFGNLDQQMNALVPAMDVRDCGDCICVSCELPGMLKEDVNIELRGNQLTISGERNESQKNEGENWITQERRYGSFSRTVPLPEGVRPENISAQFGEGMLELKVQKPLPSEPVHRIQL